MILVGLSQYQYITLYVNVLGKRAAFASDAQWLLASIARNQQPNAITPRNDPSDWLAACQVVEGVTIGASEGLATQYKLK